MLSQCTLIVLHQTPKFVFIHPVLTSIVTLLCVMYYMVTTLVVQKRLRTLLDSESMTSAARLTGWLTVKHTLVTYRLRKGSKASRGVQI